MGRDLKSTPGSHLYKPRDLAGKRGPVLLDTQVWVWYLNGDANRLSSDCISLLEDRGTQAELAVSDISFWELAVKSAKGRLTLSIDVGVWLSRAASAPGFLFLPLDRDVLLLSARLASTSHNDPVDRMLLAIAQLHSMPLVTADARIIDYAKQHPGTPVVDAR